MNFFRLIIFIFCAQVTSFVFAELDKEKNISEEQKQKKETKKKKQKNQTPTFKPSEKIKADTSVSFPVDI